MGQIIRIERINAGEFDVSPIMDIASKKIKNRFSGNYVSPTFTKGWQDCPTRQLVQNVAVNNKPKSSAAILGTIVHMMYQHMQDDWYPKTEQEIFEKWDKEAKVHHKVDYDALNDEDKSEVLKTALWYVNQYLEMPDYLPGSKLLLKDVWKQEGVQVHSEFFMRVDNFELFNQRLPTLTNLLDRLDFRDDDIYVIDYKTGLENNGDHKLQFMIYSWGVQKLYGIKPHCFIVSPGTKEKFVPITWTKREESVALEGIFKVNTEVKASVITGNFPRRENKWCSMCNIAEACLGGLPYAEVEINEDKINV